jgi:putative membrane protein insertion efficiency factor
MFKFGSFRVKILRQIFPTLKQALERLLRRLESWLQKCALLAIESYRVVLAPTFGGVCRFEPSCSQYALQAYKELSFLKATWLTLKRLISCRPGGRFGYDPVPSLSNKGRDLEAQCQLVSPHENDFKNNPKKNNLKKNNPKQVNCGFSIR